MSDTPNLDRLLRARLAVMHGRTRDGQLPPVPEDPYAQEIIDFARQLKRENADLREDNRKLALHTAAQATELADLRANLEAARKDAERYRWPRDGWHVASVYGHEYIEHGWRGETDKMKEMLEVAIDAAIAQGKEEK